MCSFPPGSGRSQCEDALIQGGDSVTVSGRIPYSSSSKPESNVLRHATVLSDGVSLPNFKAVVILLYFTFFYV